MNYLFLHRNFPSQFRYIVESLAKDPNNNVVFIAHDAECLIDGVKSYRYDTKRKIPDNSHRYTKFYEESIIHAQGTAEIAITLKQQGFIPDIICGHSWGPTMYMKDIFPDTPLLCYFEWFYNSKNSDFDFKKKNAYVDELAKLRSRNAPFLIDLYSCDAGISPTQFQFKQIPKDFHSKIKVLHDGIDTDFYSPDDHAKFLIKDKNLVFTKQDEVVTYGTRGMEEIRGFPEFMEAASILLKKRPNLHIIVAGKDRVVYGTPLKDTTYKTIMLEKLDFDMNRIHFVDSLPYNEYVNLLRISSAHIYMTYPFVCSWSLPDSMSCACPVIASRTPPVMEFIEDKKEGLLFDFFNIDEQVEKIEYALDHKDEMKQIRQNARKKILTNYDLKNILPQQIEYIHSLIKK